MKDDKKTKPLGMNSSPPYEQKFERINGNILRVGTLAQFVQEILGMEVLDALKNRPLLVMLGIEKFKTRGHRWYRLIWVGKKECWLAAEDTERYRRHRDAIAAGQAVAKETSAYFDEVSR